MTTFGIRRTFWQAQSDRDKDLLRFASDELGLGRPARFEAPGGNEWFVFDDHRFKANHIAFLGCLIANLGDIPAQAQIPTIVDDEGNDTGVIDRKRTRELVIDFCRGDVAGARTNPLVLPRDITFTEDGNPWQEILDAQGTPNQVRMGPGVPDNWTAVNDEPA